MGEWVEVAYRKWYYFNPSLFEEALMEDSPMTESEVLAGGYGAAKLVESVKGYDRNPTLRQRIAERRKFYTSELEKLNNLEKLLDENPGIEKFQDLINKTQI